MGNCAGGISYERIKFYVRNKLDGLIERISIPYASQGNAESHRLTDYYMKINEKKRKIDLRVLARIRLEKDIEFTDKMIRKSNTSGCRELPYWFI